MFVLPADEDQLRAKGYDKTPDFILQVPVGKSLSLDMHLCIEGDWFLCMVLLANIFRVDYLFNIVLKWVYSLEKSCHWFRRSLCLRTSPYTLGRSMPSEGIF